jgi:hypothetical protein
MNDIQENKLSAYEAVEKTLNTDEHKAIWTPVPYFSDLVTQFHTCISDIHALALIQARRITGYAKSKEEARVKLENAILKVCNAAIAYAIIISDSKLKGSVSYSISKVHNARDNDLTNIAGNVYDITYPLRESLVNYQISEADITIIPTLKDKLLQIIAQPRAVKVESKNATEALKLKFAETDSLLYDKLDNVIKIFKPDYPGFVEQYFHARLIINLGVRHTGEKVARIKALVLKAGTQIPLTYAMVTILGTKRFTKTDANGKFSFFFRIRGIYTLQVELDGYKRHTSEPITIKPGDEINLKIELEPNES